MIVAQITDLHIRPQGRTAYGRVDTNAMLAAAVAALEALPRKPDLVIASGDLTDCGLPEEYAVLRALLAPLSMPVYLVPGNHDRRAELFAEFAADGYFRNDDGFLHYTVDSHPVRLIGLDTVVPGSGHGEMCAARLAWLGARLDEQPDRPTMIFMHHPPFRTGLVDMDNINCRNGASMADLLRRYDNVERVVCGHHHRPVTAPVAHAIGTICPGVAHQVELDLANPGLVGKWYLEPAAFQVHSWLGTTIVSHTGYVDEYPGPYPFLGDPDAPH